MSDFNSSLPVRTENNGDVVVKVGDGTLPSQQLNIDSSGKITSKLNDGAGTSVTLGQKVSASSLPVVIASDQSTINTKDTSDGPVTPGAVAANSLLIGAQFNTALPTLTNTQQVAAQVTSRGELITIQNVSNLPVSSTNPLPVALVSALIGTSINDYNTSASLAAGATSNHDYTITTSKVFSGKKIWASASGKLKIEVQVSPDGAAFTSKWVGFNSTSFPNISIDLDDLVFLDSGVGSKIRIIRTNDDKASMDVYSTISGTEV